MSLSYEISNFVNELTYLGEFLTHLESSKQESSELKPLHFSVDNCTFDGNYSKTKSCMGEGYHLFCKKYKIDLPSFVIIHDREIPGTLSVTPKDHVNSTDLIYLSKLAKNELLSAHDKINAYANQRLMEIFKSKYPKVIELMDRAYEEYDIFTKVNIHKTTYGPYFIKFTIKKDHFLGKDFNSTSITKLKKRLSDAITVAKEEIANTEILEKQNQNLDEDSREDEIEL